MPYGGLGDLEPTRLCLARRVTVDWTSNEFVKERSRHLLIIHPRTTGVVFQSLRTSDPVGISRTDLATLPQNVVTDVTWFCRWSLRAQFMGIPRKPPHHSTDSDVLRLVLLRSRAEGPDFPPFTPARLAIAASSGATRRDGPGHAPPRCPRRLRRWWDEHKNTGSPAR